MKNWLKITIIVAVAAIAVFVVYKLTRKEEEETTTNKKQAKKMVSVPKPETETEEIPTADVLPNIEKEYQGNWYAIFDDDPNVVYINFRFKNSNNENADWDYIGYKSVDEAEKTYIPHPVGGPGVSFAHDLKINRLTGEEIK